MAKSTDANAVSHARHYRVRFMRVTYIQELGKAGSMTPVSPKYGSPRDPSTVIYIPIIRGNYSTTPLGISHPRTTKIFDASLHSGTLLLLLPFIQCLRFKESRSILPFPHLSPPPLIVKLSKLDDDDGLSSTLGRAHCRQQRAPHASHDNDDGLYSAKLAVEHDELECGQHLTVRERQFKHSMANAFDSPTPSHRPEKYHGNSQYISTIFPDEVVWRNHNIILTIFRTENTHHPCSVMLTMPLFRYSGCDDGLQRLAQPFRRLQPPGKSQLKRATVELDYGKRWPSTPDVVQQHRIVSASPPASHIAYAPHQNSSPGPLVTARALAHELRRRSQNHQLSPPGPLVTAQARTRATPVLRPSFVAPAWMAEIVHTTSEPTPVARRIARTHPEHQQAALESSASKPSLSVPQDRRFDTPAASGRLEMLWRARDGSGTICTSRRSHGKKSAPWTRVCELADVPEFPNSQSWWWDGSAATTKASLIRRTQDPALALGPARARSRRVAGAWLVGSSRLWEGKVA
ncbi:hypothetical protein DFP72DRAFT_844488 [Ephemerocybe angulata]|uniref:Uncharacterized protein n=1 Tax=Ephemerocybe angulata TaxID=980116 RepID=A0A8H6I5M5_9AGAR|nr:hypothetical protein DFP72DRAFT_844488 [Tulosesus angulatus]